MFSENYVHSVYTSDCKLKLFCNRTFSVESATQGTITYNADFSGNRAVVQDREKGGLKAKVRTPFRF